MSIPRRRSYGRKNLYNILNPPEKIKAIGEHSIYPHSVLVLQFSAALVFPSVVFIYVVSLLIRRIKNVISMSSH